MTGGVLQTGDGLVAGPGQRDGLVSETAGPVRHEGGFGGAFGPKTVIDGQNLEGSRGPARPVAREKQEGQRVAPAGAGNGQRPRSYDAVKPVRYACGEIRRHALAAVGAHGLARSPGTGRRRRVRELAVEPFERAAGFRLAPHPVERGREAHQRVGCLATVGLAAQR